MLKRKATRDIDAVSQASEDGPASPPSSSGASPIGVPSVQPLPQAGVTRPTHGAQSRGITHTRLQTGVHTLARLSRLGPAAAQANEDAFLVAQPLQTPQAGGAPAGLIPPMQLLAVFDGHSSASVSAMCAASVQQVLSQLLAAEAAAADGGALDDAAMHRALHQAFERLDSLVQPLDNSGSTATVALVTPDRLHLAWVGDSRAVLLARSGAVLASTLEHRAQREDEQERIAAAGGTVLNNSGLRVMGVLQCTRAIGDKDLQPYGVTPRPDVLSLPRTGQEEFLVLATDGLWDVLSNEEVYDYAHKTLRKVEDRCARQPSGSGTCCGCQAAGVAARALAQCARKQRGSRDDITVLLANLGGPCTCTKPPAVLSSAAGHGLPETCSHGSSRGMVGLGSSGHGVRTQLHSSPAVLDASPFARPHGAAALQPEQQQPQQLPGLQYQAAQHPQHPGEAAAPGSKQQQQHLPLQQQQHLQPQQQQQQHMARHGLRQTPSPHVALLLQPSVAPAHARHVGRGHVATAPDCTAAAGLGAAAAASSDTVVHTVPLSDLAMSSPFAMVLGEVVDVALEADVDGHHHTHAPMAAGKSAPPGPIAALAAAMPGASARRHSHSLNVALGNSRSCGSVGGLPQAKMGSTELPVVVLT